VHDSTGVRRRRSFFCEAGLDPETWRAIVRADKSITEKKKTERLELIETGLLNHVLNNALLHVLVSLANNHFMEVRQFLGHRNILGGYTGLMPHYLFAVLFHKVVILRQLVKDQTHSDQEKRSN
jgi:hypothetical protein